MELKVFQKGFNYSQDGPGNRLVYHIRGCNMRCPWCANPEGLTAVGDGTDVEELINEAVRSKAMFFDNGGVTFTGGEPTVQFDALLYVLTKLRENGIHTTIETNASHSRFPELIKQVDHLIMDFKQPFPEKHKEITGIPYEKVIENIRYACANHPEVVIHIPLIEGYNASEETLLEFAKVISSLERKNVLVEPLWYHEYGKEKWDKLGLEYMVNNGFISDEKKQMFLNILHEHGIKTVRT